MSGAYSSPLKKSHIKYLFALNRKDDLRAMGGWSVAKKGVQLSPKNDFEIQNTSIRGASRKSSFINRQSPMLLLLTKSIF